jgi:hypothetical protein
MNARRDRSVAKRPIKDLEKTRSTKPKVQATEWERTDERLDEASDTPFRPVTRCRSFKMFVAASNMRLSSPGSTGRPSIRER